MGDVAGLRLEQKQQVAVLLRPFVIREETLLRIRSVVKVASYFVLLQWVSVNPFFCQKQTHLFQSHPVLDQQGNARVQVSYILLQDEVLLGLRRDLRLEFSQVFLRYRGISTTVAQHRERPDAPRARSSEISKSLSLADMDRYSAVTDIRLDWRSDRVSCDDMVFCRAMG